ncbi:MAG: hypothetical protein JO307_19675 [Bryobacterales bacterium]|nr:hypothetical protein [Bryobacterales bacterium]MBV9401461.1 hypothetical protein [Bryobacterales bacterium]
MICLKDNSQGAEILTDYCAGSLEAIRAAEFEAHLHDCGTCRSQVELQRQVWNALDAWPPVEASPGFDARLYARIESEQKRWWRRAMRGLLWNPLVPAAGAAAMLAIAVLAWIPGEHRAPQPAPSASAEKIDVQQVEQALDDMDLLIPVSQSPRVL